MLEFNDVAPGRMMLSDSALLINSDAPASTIRPREELGPKLRHKGTFYFKINGLRAMLN
jgi:hypothetical protein